METVIYKSSVEAIQDGNLDISSKNEEDLISDNMCFHQNISKNKIEQMDLKLNEKVNYIVSDHIMENSKEILCSGTSGNTSEASSEKTLSSTLIEHTFKVVKNLFSPDKNRSKANSVINQQKSSSQSPQNSIYIPSKPDFCNLQETDIDSHVTCSTPTDNNLKGENFCTNQLGPIPFNFEPHNSTDDSFLTTVSLVDESFQSAVTHLDENGENSKNDNVDREIIFSDSQNFNMEDVSSNDTINSSEVGLDNTMLKNSLTQTENKSQSLLNNNLNDVITPNIERSENNDIPKEKYLFNSQKNNEGPTNETENEKNLEKNFQEIFELKNVKEVSKNTDLLAESETMTSEKTALSNNENNNLNVVSPLIQEDIKILKSDYALNNSCLKTSEKTENNQQKIIENLIGGENEEKFEKNIKDLKSCSIKEPIKNLEVIDSKIELLAEINKNDFSFKEENIPGISEIEVEDALFQLVERNNMCHEKEFDIENSISTTTVVLSESDSILDFHDSLKENRLEPEMNIKKETDNIPPIISTSTIPDDFTSPKNKKMLSQIENKQHKRLIKSEANTPNKMSNPSKNKLNKSADSVGTKNLSKNSRRRKTLGQKKESPVGEFDIVNEKVSYLSIKTSNYASSEENSKNENSSPSSQTLPNIASQQSYTVLNTIDKNLQRPVILSFENLTNNSFKSKSEEWDPNLSKESNAEKVNANNNDHSDISAENISKISTPKTSTPIFGNTGTAKKRMQNENKISGAKVLDLSPSEEELHSNVDFNLPNQTSEANKPFEFLFEEDEVRAEISPVLTDIQRQLALPNSSEKEKSSSSNSFELNNTWVKAPKILNSTYDKKTDSINCQLNQTYNKTHVLEEVRSCKNEETATISPKAKNLNQTFDIKKDSPEGVMNQTYDKNSNKLNKTYDKKSELLNQTFDVPDELTNKINQTFKKKSSGPDNLNQTYSKKMEKIDEIIFKDEKFQTKVPATINKTYNEDVIEAKACPTTILEKPFFKPELPVIFDEGMGDNKESLNASFSTNSSNASLFLNSNATIVLNQENIVDDLSSTSKETVHSVNLKKDEPESSNNSDKPCALDDFQIQNHSIFVNKQLPFSPKYDKVHCDLELVQLIQEQFSSKDIEKICSVVDDMSIKKLSNQIQKASEQFVKSLQDVIPNEDLEEPKNESFPEKFVNPLTPQGFEFLSSIQGKPTGRDLSRESLYVKFDPLVQPPNSNSLIDFTKEVESVFSALECVPENIAVSENDAYMHLLTISPEKKPDDIVPPLTPLSQRGKKNLRDDEKLKDLQNEIFFLKNLYAERERNNKAKMEEYESQITKLTGQNCILEDKIKESNEREKSLVKKVKEQNQNLEQLKVIMEEYSKVITKLTIELEELKKDSKNKLEALTSEKDSYMMHLQNTEAAFSDVHAKYEKSKITIMNLKSNETMFRNTIAEQIQKLEEYKEKAKILQENAYKEFQKMQEELSETKSNHNQETTRLRALLRKTELKLEAIQESLDQKIKENEQLTAIFDELIERKK